MTEGEGGEYLGAPRRWKLLIAPAGNVALAWAAAAFGLMFGVLVRDAGAEWLKIVGVSTAVGLSCLLAGGTFRMLERIAWPSLWERRRRDLYRVLSSSPPTPVRWGRGVAVFTAVTAASFAAASFLGYGWEVTGGWFGGVAATGVAIWAAVRRTNKK